MNCNCNAKTFNTDAHAFNCPCRRDVVRYSTIAGTFEGDTLDEAKAASDEIKAAWIDAKDMPAELERMRELGFVPAGENCTCDNCSCKDDFVEPKDQELPMPESVEDTLTDEDRALLDRERLILLVEEVRAGATGITPNEAESLARTLAYINELEKQIEDWDDAFCEVITRYQTQSASATDLEILDKLRKGAYGE